MHLVGATEFPMVGGKDDNRILRQLQVIQLIENRLKMLVIIAGNDSNLLIVFYVQIMPDDFVMQLHRF